jgi:GMP synthase (glutamine-hydrolysing)
MRIHYLQHVPFEGLGYIGKWADDCGYSVTRTSLFKGEKPPDPAEFDCLVVMGGPMGVDDVSQYAWLTPEKHFIEQVIHTEKQVLGICLGAQLIAQVLGARVFRNKEKEIGWYPVTATETAGQSLMERILPQTFQAFHWHGDTFDLPTGAVHLARSEACRHQAFSYGENTLGLQFHLESTRESIDLLIQNCGDELVKGKYIQGEEMIRRQSERISPSNELMKAILEEIAVRYAAE